MQAQVSLHGSSPTNSPPQLYFQPPQLLDEHHPRASPTSSENKTTPITPSDMSPDAFQYQPQSPLLPRSLAHQHPELDFPQPPAWRTGSEAEKDLDWENHGYDPRPQNQHFYGHEEDLGRRDSVSSADGSCDSYGSGSPSGSGSWGSGSWSESSGNLFGDGYGSNGREFSMRKRERGVSEKIHICEICGSSFSTSGHRTRHMRLHSGEKQFACLLPQCPQRFTRKDNMKQHFRTHVSNVSRTRLKISQAMYNSLLPPSRPGPKTHHLQDIFDHKPSRSRSSSRMAKNRAQYTVQEDIYRLPSPNRTSFGATKVKVEEDQQEEDGVRRMETSEMNDTTSERGIVGLGNWEDTASPPQSPPASGHTSRSSAFHGDYGESPPSSSSSSLSNTPSSRGSRRNRGLSLGSNRSGCSNHQGDYESPTPARRGSYQGLLEQIDAHHISSNSPGSPALNGDRYVQEHHLPPVPRQPILGRPPAAHSNRARQHPQLSLSMDYHSRPGGRSPVLRHHASLSDPLPRLEEAMQLPSSSANQLGPSYMMLPSLEPPKSLYTKPRSHSTPQPVHVSHHQRLAAQQRATYTTDSFPASSAQPSMWNQQEYDRPLSAFPESTSILPPSSWVNPSTPQYDTQSSPPLSSPARSAPAYHPHMNFAQAQSNSQETFDSSTSLVTPTQASNGHQRQSYPNSPPQSSLYEASISNYEPEQLATYDPRRGDEGEWRVSDERESVYYQ